MDELELQELFQRVKELYSEEKIKEAVSLLMEASKATGRSMHSIRCSFKRSKREKDSKEQFLNKIKKEFSEEGYELQEEIFKNQNTKMKVKCPNGHEWSVTYLNWSANKNRCSYCSGKKKKSLEDLKKQVQEEKYKILSEEYQGALEHLHFECPKGHQYWSTWSNWHQGHRCPYCSKTISRQEKNLFSCYKHLNPEKTKKVIPPLELDLYFSQQKLAIEYCGLYWHSSIHDRIIPSYHYRKLRECNSRGIRLITIFEDEWLSNKELCLSRINAALGIKQTRIYARKCVLKKISVKEGKQFLQKYHLQGSSGREIAFGLFYEEVLVSVMTLGKPSRAHVSKNVRTLELKRFASLPNTIVVGGASKLFKQAIVYAKQKEYERIVSYCDLRWGTGTVYEKLGMQLLHTSKYTPHYTDFVRRWRNQSFASKGGKSEKELVEEAKVYKIYDCGHQTWEYRIFH